MSQWTSDDGLIDVTSAFQGFSAPLHELIDDIHRRGWTVSKIHVKDGNYVAEGKNPHGEKLQAAGRTDSTAAANLLIKIMRREFMRGSSVRAKLGAWDHVPIEQQFDTIAQAYAGAPVYEPKAATAWMELAQDFGRRAQIVRMQVSVEITPEPVPYESADELREDVTKRRHVVITRAYASHPVWSEQQMLDYRLVVDVLGHTVSGGDWGWHGTCMAFAALAPLLTETGQKALYTELLGQAAFGQFYRQWGPQKIAFLDKEIEKLQKKENGPGHHPVHPSQSIVPTQLPSVFTAWMPNPEFPDSDDPMAKRRDEQIALMYQSYLANGLTPDEAREKATWYIDLLGGSSGPDGGGVKGPYEGVDQSQPPSFVSVPQFNKPRWSSVTPTDPNADWESGVHPLQDNAYMWQRDEQGLDPLNIHDATDRFHLLEPGVSNMHPQLAQQAVVNALRSSLLGTRSNPRDHAIHYQDLMHIPAGVDDPMAYVDALEGQRERWNQAQGYAPGSHKQFWPQEQQFRQWVKAMNPHLDDGDVARVAKSELMHMMIEEEERILAQDEGEQLPAEVIQHEAYEAIKRRLKALTRSSVNQDSDFGEDHLFHEATHHADMYPPYLTSRLRPMAQISRHADQLADAAREDLLSHKGHGHHFRATALNLGIPGLGPRQVSHAWMHLAPQTSQLAIINPEIADALGHDYSTETTNRDYFKHEREIAAARDSAGYGHVPLGPFSTALWDLYAGGPGWHPDRGPFKPYGAAPHGTIDWNAQVPPMTGLNDPYWWNSTQEARDQAAQDFDRNVATQFGRDEFPFQKTAAREPNIVYHDEIDPTNMLGNAQGYWGRWPTAYDEDTHTVHVGPEGSMHSQLRTSLDHPEWLDGYLGYEGWIGHNPEVDSGLDPTERQIGSTNVGWYNGSPGPHIDYALATRQWPRHPDSDVEAEDQGYGHAPRLTSTKTAMQWDDGGNLLNVYGPNAGRPHVPWITHPTTGERVTGQPGTSIMQHAMTTFGHQDPREVWAQEYEAGKGSGTIAKVAGVDRGWEPGAYGKGVVTPEGEVRHWLINERTGRPNHDEATKMLGLPAIGGGRGPMVDGLRGPYGLAFGIEPSGQLSLSGGDESLWPAALAARPDWHRAGTVAKVASDWNPSADTVRSWYDPAAVQPFESLPPEAQAAIQRYEEDAALDAGEWDGDESTRPQIPGEQPFGYTRVPMSAFTTALFSRLHAEGDSWPDWDTYHQDYVSHPDMPDHGSSRWPVLTDPNLVVDDGFHRLHDYYRKGDQEVPIVWPG